MNTAEKTIARTARTSGKDGEGGGGGGGGSEGGGGLQAKGVNDSLLIN
jgi:hypothetical protein